MLLCNLMYELIEEDVDAENCRSRVTRVTVSMLEREGERDREQRENRKRREEKDRTMKGFLHNDSTKPLDYGNVSNFNSMACHGLVSDFSISLIREIRKYVPYFICIEEY